MRAQRIERAVDKAFAAGVKPMEYGGKDGTNSIAKAVLARRSTREISMLFSVFTLDNPDAADKRKAVHGAHVAHLKSAKDLA